MFTVTFIIMTVHFQYILTCKAVANCDKDGNGYCEIYSYKNASSNAFFYYECLATTASSFVLFCFFKTNFTNCLHISIIKLVTGWVLKQGMSIRMAQNCLAEVGA